MEVSAQVEESFSTESPGVIVMHPGSSTLRLGLSTQLDPFNIPHVIAYRRAFSEEDTPTSNDAKVLKRGKDPSVSTNCVYVLAGGVVNFLNLCHSLVPTLNQNNFISLPPPLSLRNPL